MVWTRVKGLLGPRFFTGTHVVLLSPWAGDVSTLLGMGVDLRKIVGVDIDRHAVAAARHKFPGLRCLNEDIISALERLKKERVVSAFLDFCSPFRDETVGKAAEAALFVQPSGVIIFAAKMGREQGGWSKTITSMKTRSKLRGREVKSRAFHMRSELLTSKLTSLCNGYSQKPRPLDFYRYRSDRGDDRRSEMLICISQLCTRPPAVKDIIKSAQFKSIVADHRSVGAEASRLAQAGELAHLLLNLKPESIPAYKAHLTRGSYKGVPSPTAPIGKRWP
jgi:hypothetical protein